MSKTSTVPMTYNKKTWNQDMVSSLGWINGMLIDSMQRNNDRNHDITNNT